MEDSKSNFLSLANCEKLDIISVTLRKNLVAIVNNSTAFKKDLYFLAAGLINDIENKLYDLPDEDCDCIDFRFYYQLMIDTINGVVNENAFRQRFQHWEKAIATDLIIDNISRDEIIFNPLGSPSLVGETFYFDFNVYQFIENNNLISKIKNLNLNVIYSPAHLEEVYRMHNQAYQDIRVKSISSITKNNVVLPLDNSLKIYTEEPIYSYQRVLANVNINDAVENYRVIKNSDRTIFFATIQDDKFKHILESQDIFEEIDEAVFKQLLFFAGCSLKKEEFKKENKTYSEILHMIYSLYDVLDNIAFSLDTVKNNNRSLKSSIYDIEHLIYASYCNNLVTSDLKFSKRAKQIYRFMNIDTKILYFKQREGCDNFFTLLV